MTIEDLIPAEITNDSFYMELNKLASRADLKTFLEIGSSTGMGSTQAIATSLKLRSDPEARLFCMELSRPRFISLVNAHEENPRVYPYNLSSVATSDFATEEQVRLFYRSTSTNLNRYSIESVLQWRRQDLEYIDLKRLNYNGINFIRDCNSIDNFDFVLIDGSEFTGEMELQYVWGAKVIALDDVNAFKCFSAYLRLKTHYGYKLIAEDLGLRNGFAIFERAY